MVGAVVDVTAHSAARVLSVAQRPVVGVSGDYDQFFRDEYARVVRVCHGVLGDQARAEEAAQEAFLRLYERWERIARYQRPDAWVRRVAVRAAVRMDSRDRARRLLERRVTPAPPSPAATSAGDVSAALKLLPRNQRVAVVLHYLDDLSVAEIADVLGCAQATARVHLHRGRRRLAGLLHEQVSVDD